MTKQRFMQPAKRRRLRAVKCQILNRLVSTGNPFMWGKCLVIPESAIKSGKVKIDHKHNFGVPSENIPLYVEWSTPKPERDFPCPECETGEMVVIGFTDPSGITRYECNECGNRESYP